jgi:ribosomal peptide maturation radical SAM protein 1
MAGDRSPGLNGTETAAGPRRLRALLIVAPFGIIEYPNLGVSLLKAGARRAGFHCDLRYASLEFAGRITWAAYLTTYFTDAYILLSDRIFAPQLFGDRIPSWGAYWEEVLRPYDDPSWQFFRPADHFGRNRRGFERLQDAAATFVEDFVSDPELASYDVFGFSTTYGQNMATLSIAKRLKERYPDKVVILGGANCHGVMGEQLIQSFPFVDYVCNTEGDLAFPAFLDALERGVPVEVQGIVHRMGEGQGRTVGPLSMVFDLDRLPYPDFSDFFEQFHLAGAENVNLIAMPMEASRGCWWGEKHHCTFCGLNGETMAYRSKSSERVVAELDHLIERFGRRTIMMTDNILHHRAGTDLLPLLTPAKVDLFFEVKANITRPHLEQMVNAGIRHVQPGIESLSTRILHDMDKGVDSFQNLQLLKWGKELGVRLSWNLLCGFPSERDEDYAEMAALIPKIHHFAPPRGFGQVSVDRFSPMFKWPERFGMQIEPFPAYRYVYALPAEEIRNIAYSFQFTSPRSTTALSLAPPPYAHRAFSAFLIWRKFTAIVEFSYEVDADGTVHVHDTRTVSVEEDTHLGELESRIFLALDAAQTVESLGRVLEAEGEPVAEADIRRVLADFEDRNYLHSEDGKYLVLANRKVEAQPHDAADRECVAAM